MAKLQVRGWKKALAGPDILSQREVGCIGVFNRDGPVGPLLLAGCLHTNPVITRSGFPRQTPGSLWFLQSHRIQPGLSLSWLGEWGPMEGATPPFSCLPRGRASELARDTSGQERQGS